MQANEGHAGSRRSGSDARARSVLFSRRVGSPASDRRFTRRAMRKLRIRESPYVTDWVYDYGQMAQNMLRKPQPGYKRFPGVTPAWDNSARRKQQATIITDSTPAKYEEWLSEVVERFVPYSPEENFIFINAWNEWAEGAMLEPSERCGDAYLRAFRSGVDAGSH